jgi:excisionase family DNA binding protein
MIPIYGPDFGPKGYYDTIRHFVKTKDRRRPPQGFLVSEVAEVTGLSRQTIRKYVKEGVLHEMKLTRDHREIWITKDSLMKWLEGKPDLIAAAMRYMKKK